MTHALWIFITVISVSAAAIALSAAFKISALERDFHVMDFELRWMRRKFAEHISRLESRLNDEYNTIAEIYSKE